MQRDWTQRKLAEEAGGRAAAGVETDLTLTGSRAPDSERTQLPPQRRQDSRGRRQRMNQGHRCRQAAGVIGAVRWGGDVWLGTGSKAGSSSRAHRAAVRAVAAAAGGQARLGAGRKRDRKRPQPEKQNQKARKPATHLDMMVHPFRFRQGVQKSGGKERTPQDARRVSFIICLSHGAQPAEEEIPRVRSKALRIIAPIGRSGT